MTNPLFKSRSDPEAARGVIKGIFTTTREGVVGQYLAFLGNDIAYLFHNHNDRWGVSLFPDVIRLNVGWVESLVLHRGGLRVLVEVASAPPSHLLEDLAYTRAPGCRHVSLPLHKLHSLLLKFEQAHRAALRIAARLPTQPSIRDAHSTGIISYLSQYLGRQIQNPSYVSEGTMTSGATGYWVVRGRPKENAWTEVLQPGRRVLWHTARLPRKLTRSDRVFLWSSSPDRQLVGLASVTSPSAGTDANGDSLFKVEYLTRKLRSMPGIEELRAVPVLGDASFLKPGPATTILPITPQQARTLYGLMCAGDPELQSIWPDLRWHSEVSLPEIDELYVAREGNRRWVQHRQIERDRVIVDKKIRAVLRSKHRLDCEVCSFNFEEAFGHRGKDFCEVHHVIPLSLLDAETETQLQDLAIVCSNCHRMLHREPFISIEQLRDLLKTLGPSPASR